MMSWKCVLDICNVKWHFYYVLYTEPVIANTITNAKPRYPDNNGNNETAVLFHKKIPQNYPAFITLRELSKDAGYVNARV